MKSQLALNRIGLWMFVAAVAIALSLSGCATVMPFTVPFTDLIIQEFGGKDRMQEFNFYISKSITITYAVTDHDSLIVDGIGVRNTSITNNTVTIKAYERGKLQDYRQMSSSSPDNYFNVTFGNFDFLIPFAKQGNITNETKYEILYTDSSKKMILRNAIEYTISYTDEKEPPYLMIEIKDVTSIKDVFTEISN